mmetsp:Transcript_107598/g.342903  ORF Transcript_107598/g.342903 Transcript_107598/m.342903 type:complete len:233 (+) Transcript_107598:183-881(+)
MGGHVQGHHGVDCRANAPPAPHIQDHEQEQWHGDVGRLPHQREHARPKAVGRCCEEAAQGDEPAAHVVHKRQQQRGQADQSGNDHRSEPGVPVDSAPNALVVGKDALGEGALEGPLAIGREVDCPRCDGADEYEVLQRQARRGRHGGPPLLRLLLRELTWLLDVGRFRRLVDRTRTADCVGGALAGLLQGMGFQHEQSQDKGQQRRHAAETKRTSPDVIEVNPRFHQDQHER